MLFGGYEIVASKACADLVQAKRHKKKRINKKWRKRYGLKAVPWKKYFVDTVNMKIYGHPMMVGKLIEEIKIKQQKEGCL